MELVVDVPQVTARKVRVNLGGANVGVTEHGLNGSQIRATLDQVGGKRVTKLVRGDRARDAGL